MKDKRPRNISPGDIMAMQLPITAKASILHRISGVLLFLLMPVLLWLLDFSLSSEQNFLQLKSVLDGSVGKLATLFAMAFLIYHFCAGIRHLLMDLGYGEEKESGKQGAVAMMVVTAILVALTGVWLWL
ncbi:succinate dehydrogenase, cytochrome b556 subunit [Pelagibaculum spongiae]|uniref:Succinate dehydrogenase cytochrome b556 subunit n=1 Tax=Pelagibaculum spongiae TaxID=2080658 RepID=A0A2V1H0Q9_9GAMM|nr:succinate dehydrogenase, cytochrome b556 subunit [Pelagibaculum spongiae]PVZ69592.1 succinate dehydrogenase, cytochrome b556 subunit [Pelagibaculum spongiae]